MSFDGALGHVQIASDFGIVASLQQKIDDLPLPGSQLLKLLVHEQHLADAQRSPQVWHPNWAARIWNSGL